MDFFFENLGLLIFLFFLFLQFIGSLIGQRTKGKRSPLPEVDQDVPVSEEGPSTFEEAIRQIQEALREASQPKPSRSDADGLSPATSQDDTFPSVPDEENGPAFQHFDDFELQGDAHFSSGAHERFEAAEAERLANYERAYTSDQATQTKQGNPYVYLRGKQSYSNAATQPGPAVRPATSVSQPASVARLRSKLRSPEDVQDAYRLHVILSKPRALKKR